MTKKKVYFFLFDGYSDWEIAHLMPEIQKNENYDLKTFSIDRLPLKSMGGLTIMPDLKANEIDYQNAGMIIIPGGDAWENKGIKGLDKYIEKARSMRVPIAGICGATVYLANLGFLNNTKHTSNGLAYLKEKSETYTGDANYQKISCVVDDAIITANGTASLEFAREIMIYLKIYEVIKVEEWYELFKDGITEE